MIAYIAGLLLFVGLGALLKTSSRHDRLVSVLLTGLFFALFYRFCVAATSESFGIYSVLWDSTPAGALEFEIVSNEVSYALLFPCFLMTAVALLNNLFFPYEMRKKNYVAVMSLNLFCLVMLASGQNYIQMITFVFVIDVLSQFLIQNREAGRRYALYNLIADMSLFGILALLNGQVETLKVSSMRNYHHRDLVAFLLLFSLSVKFGYCVFRPYLADLGKIRFHRLITVSYFSSPLAALILLARLYPLLQMSSVFVPIFNVLTGGISGLGAIGIVREKSLKGQAVFLNLILFAFLSKLLESSGFVWTIHFSYLLILCFFYNMTLYYLHYYLERTSGFLNKNQDTLVSVAGILLVGLWVGVTAAFSVQTMAMLTPRNVYWCCGVLLLLVLMSAVLFYRRGAMPLGRVRPLPDKRPIPVLAVLYVLSGYAFWKEIDFWPYAAVACGSFLLLLCFNPTAMFVSSQKAKEQTECSALTKGNIALIYCIFSKISVRIQTLFSLRGFEVGEGVVSIFRQVSRWGAVRYILCSLLAVGLLVWCFLRGR